MSKTRITVLTVNTDPKPTHIVPDEWLAPNINRFLRDRYGFQPDGKRHNWRGDLISDEEAEAHSEEHVSDEGVVALDVERVLRLANSIAGAVVVIVDLFALEGEEALDLLEQHNIVGSEIANLYTDVYQGDAEDFCSALRDGSFVEPLTRYRSGV